MANEAIRIAAKLANFDYVRRVESIASKQDTIRTRRLLSELYRMAKEMRKDATALREWSDEQAGAKPDD